jgi:hypothetical protein
MEEMDGLMSSIAVNCVKCDHQNSIKFEILEGLQFTKCERCGVSFNLFDVYRSLYETIPICERMVDVSVDRSYAKYFLEASNATEKYEIEKNLENNHFQELLQPIFQDMILYGNSFVQMIFDSRTLKLNRLEPRELQFRIDWVQEPPFKSNSQKIVEIKSRDNPSINYEVKDCLHFKGGLVSHEPVGDSIFGLWFSTWYFLRDLPEAIPLLDMRGSQYSDLKWFRDFKESNVLGAAGIPHNLIFPWMQIHPNIVKIEEARFLYDIENRRNTISRSMERKLFPKILKRPYEYEDFPRLKWQTD